MNGNNNISINKIWLYLLLFTLSFCTFNDKAYALVKNEKNIPLSEEEITQYIEDIKEIMSTNWNLSDNEYYIIWYGDYAKDDLDGFTSLNQKNTIYFCNGKKEKVNLTNNNKNLDQICDSNLWYYRYLNNKMDWASLSGITVYIKNYEQVLETNIEVTYFEDITDSSGNVIVPAANNIFNSGKEETVENEKIIIPGQPAKSWIPFIYPKENFDELIEENYNLDPNTETMIIFYISINLIIFIYLMKAIKKYIYHIFKKVGVIK